MQADETTTTPGAADALAEPPELKPEDSPLWVRGLNVAYRRKVVVWDVDFDCPQGRTVAIIGPNGAGKSTLLKACLELVPRASGRVLFFGRPYRKVRHMVAYVPQRESVDWDFPVSALDVVTMGLYRNIGWCLPVRRRHRERAMEALEHVGLADFAGRQISQLSGGQQQRVFLARALVQSAKLFLMDEPFASVDASTERAIVAILRELRGQGKTVICIHHDLQTIPDYFDHVAMLNMRMVARGPVGQIFTPDNLRKTYGGKLALLDQAVHSTVETSEAH
ncbi:MAG: ABC transporter ATP-binding protein [Verrucomicrobiota bacterium]